MIFLSPAVSNLISHSFSLICTYPHNQDLSSRWSWLARLQSTSPFVALLCKPEAATLQTRKPTYIWLSPVSCTTAWQAHGPPPARGSADYSGQPKRIRLILTRHCGFALSRLIHLPTVKHKFKAAVDRMICQSRLNVTDKGNFWMVTSEWESCSIGTCLLGDTDPLWFKGQQV